MLGCKGSIKSVYFGVEKVSVRGGFFFFSTPISWKLSSKSCFEDSAKNIFRSLE